jgi:DNA invertase Pin-like site-specific DNA recombinase
MQGKVLASETWRRETILKRQREDIAKAQREGKYKGRVPTARRKAADILRLKGDGESPMEIASRLGIGRASVYRVLSEQTGDNWRKAA